MKLGIIGGGVVGQATARSYLEHVEEVRVYDIVREKCTHDLDSTLACDLVFICLPTPQKKDSLECNTDYLVEFFESLPEDYRSSNLVLRSTVPIGFTKRTREVCKLPNLVHSPEFLTARCATVDAQLPSRSIIGINCNKMHHDWSITDDEGRVGAQPLYQLYKSRFPHVPIQVMSSDESEAVKLFQNSFFAVKVAFWNECNMLATKLGLDWERVMEGILSDGRIHPSHTKVPGPDGKYGFGGSCLPKDLSNLCYMMIQNGIEGWAFNHSLCRTALMHNWKHRKRS